MNDDVPTNDEMLLSTETIQSILSRLDALESILNNVTCTHQGRIHMDYVFNGEDEVQVFTCDNCGDEV